uniref:Uncharacterized protein n=1 Tax=Arundo donax TaxID=35708 RepID=A0A0A8YEZ8_ARUDO
MGEKRVSCPVSD